MSRRFDLVVENDGLVYTQRYVKLEEGERLVEQRKAERITRPDGSLIGYLLLNCAGGVSSERARAMMAEATGRVVNSCTAFSKAEIDAIAGDRFKHGASRTAGLSEEARIARIRRSWMQPEDLVETARAKLDCYTGTH